MAAEGIQRPRMEVSADANSTLLSDAESLQQQIYNNPEYFIRALGLLGVNKEVVMKTLDFVDAYPEGSVNVVRNLVSLIDDPDKYGAVKFDPETEQALKKDPQIITARDDTRAEKSVRMETWSSKI